MQGDLVNYLFGPMSKFYCIWFFYLSVFGFILFTVAFLSFLFMGLSGKKSRNFYFQMFMVCLGYFIFYFQNRLLYSMCGNNLV